MTEGTKRSLWVRGRTGPGVMDKGGNESLGYEVRLYRVGRGLSDCVDRGS